MEDIEQYPKGTDGGPMMFLARINLAEMPPLPEFPHEGLLQFYVENDGSYGLYGGCVVKHISEYKTDETALVNENPYSDDYAEDLPFSDNCKITFKQEEIFIGTECPEFQDKFQNISKKEEKALFELCCASGSRVGGYPYFVQRAPAYYKDSSEYILLLQLDVDDTSGLMFGDSGNCTFIISRRDLLTGNFTKVHYDWQCC